MGDPNTKNQPQQTDPTGKWDQDKKPGQTAGQRETPGQTQNPGKKPGQPQQNDAGNMASQGKGRTSDSGIPDDEDFNAESADDRAKNQPPPNEDPNRV